MYASYYVKMQLNLEGKMKELTPTVLSPQIELHSDML